MLAIRNLHLRYPNGTHALRGIDLNIERGSFVVIIGLSGSGKSTLLRCINRLVTPTEGSIIFDGQDITHVRGARLRRLRSRCGMIFQQFNLLKRKTALSNVLTGTLGRQGGMRTMVEAWPRADRDKAIAALERVGLSEKAFSRADQLSGGQQQRVAIARALMQEPTMLLADEPVASLDPATSHSVLDHLRDINQHDGVTVLCNIHFLSLAREYGTRAIALKDGRVVFDGAPDEITNERFKEIYGQDAVEVEIR